MLAALGERLLGSLREGDTLVRWGGEEFLVVLVGPTESGSVEAAERILDRVRASTVLLPDGTELQVRLSAGVASRGRLEGCSAL